MLHVGRVTASPQRSSDIALVYVAENDAQAMTVARKRTPQYQRALRLVRLHRLWCKTPRPTRLEKPGQYACRATLSRQPGA